MKRFVGLALLFGCSSGGLIPGAPPRDLTGTAGVEDLGSTDFGRPFGDFGPPDLLSGMPSDADCFYAWKTLGSCPAPQITESYLANNCVGTSGIFVVGRYFQSANQFDTMNGFMPHGPYALPSKLNRDTWNWISPRIMCITTSADTATWTGFAMQVKNPDGQTSNAVTVSNQLATRPPFPSSGSTDPFDLNACEDAGMTQAEAKTHFAPAASTATLGTLAIQKRARSCNTVTGCASWGAATSEAMSVAGLQITGSVVYLTLNGTVCGVLGSGNYTVTSNRCSATGGSAGSYELHVAAACLMLGQRIQSTVAGDGSYTQTDYGAVLRY